MLVLSAIGAMLTVRLHFARKKVSALDDIRIYICSRTQHRLLVMEINQTFLFKYLLCVCGSR